MTIDLLDELVKLSLINFLTFFEWLLIELSLSLTRKSNRKLLVIETVIAQVVLIFQFNIDTLSKAKLGMTEESLLWRLILIVRLTHVWRYVTFTL